MVPGFEAPVKLAYSARNRSAAIRVPFVQSDKARRIEVRFPDPLANPYLAFAVIIAAGLKGIEEGYILEASSNPESLPTNLEEAINAMEKSALVRATLGEDVFEYVLRNKRAEWAEYRKQVSEYELNRYLPVL